MAMTTKNNKSYAEEYAKLQLEKIEKRKRNWKIVRRILFCMSLALLLLGLFVLEGFGIYATIRDGCKAYDIVTVVGFGIILLIIQTSMLFTIIYGMEDK